MFSFFFSNFNFLICKIIFFVILIFAIAGCSSIPFLENESDFDSSVILNKPKKLEVPPDLITPAKDRKFSIPSSGSTMSEFESSVIKDGSREIRTNILPAITGMEIRSYGNHRVLIVEKPVEYLWPILRNFWVNSGFEISKESPEIGVIETDWFEDKRNIPQGLVRGFLGRVFDNIYDSGERDRYKMRLERLSVDKTEISIAHKGLIEVVDDRPEGTISWKNKPTDRKLEEEYLKLIMISLGAHENKASDLIETKAVSSDVLLTSDESTTQIKISENFDRSWRRVGMAIDRLEFEVEDRIRTKGTYFIRYRDPTIGKKKKSFFSNLFSFASSPEKLQIYRVQLTSNGDETKILVLDKDGIDNSATTKSIASILFDQLK